MPATPSLPLRNPLFPFFLAIGLSATLGGCGSAVGGGGNSSVNVGGKEGDSCNEAFVEGCYANSGTWQRMKCVNKQWAFIAACPSGQICQETIVNPGQPARTTECRLPITGGGGGGNDTTTTSADGTAGGDSQSGGDGVVVGDGIAPGDGIVLGDGLGGDGTVWPDGISPGDGTTGSDVKPGDAGNPVAAMLVCAQSACPDQWASCNIDTACLAVIACVNQCSGDVTTCALTCVQKSGNSNALTLMQCAQTACANPPVCGDGKCTGAEAETCPGDCGGGPVCGNGNCEPGETSASCPVDCRDSPICGNGKCEVGEDSANCLTDCPATATCGNGKCDGSETPLTCPKDCPTAACCAAKGYKCGMVSACGGSCGTCATNQTCSAANQCVATTPVCGNGTCDAGETSLTCAKDCPTSTTKYCGNLTCETGETTTGCPIDCPPNGCGNGTCAATETVKSCPQDCDPQVQCVLGNCETEYLACTKVTACQTILTCAKACGSNLTCATTCNSNGSAAGKTAYAPFLQCYTDFGCAPGAATCPNGTCDNGETSATCPADCPATTNDGCTAKPSGTGSGCGGCACESCVCSGPIPGGSSGGDSWCCTNGWDASCVSECVACGTVCGP